MLMSLKAEVAVVSLLYVGNKPDRIELKRFSLTEKAATADRSVVDDKNVFFGRRRISIENI